MREIGFWLDPLYPEEPTRLGGPAEKRQRVVEAAVRALPGLLEDLVENRESGPYWPVRERLLDCAQRTAEAPSSGRIIVRDPRREFSATERATAWSEAVVAAGQTDPPCALCGEPVTRSDAELDHRVPWSRGGRTELANAQVVHARCNRRKGAATP